MSRNKKGSLVDLEGDKGNSEEKPERTNESRVEHIEKELNDLKSDVKKISDELKMMVTELKKSIVDIRSAISEIENPFNLLRAISSEEELRKIVHGEAVPGVKSITVGKPEEGVEEEGETAMETEATVKEVTEPTLPPEAEKRQVERELVPKKAAEATPFPPLRGGARYLDLVWQFLDRGLSADEIAKIAESYEYLGILPTDSSAKIASIASAAEKAKARGVSKLEFLLNMYKAAALSGVKITSSDHYMLISMMEKSVRRAHTSEQ